MSSVVRKKVKNARNSDIPVVHEEQRDKFSARMLQRKTNVGIFVSAPLESRSRDFLFEYIDTPVENETISTNLLEFHCRWVRNQQVLH